ncbi:MAG: DUF2339 domain-containing protein [Ferruginibacter sp.]
MEVFAIILLIAFIVIVLNQNSAIRRQFEGFDRQFKKLQRELEELKTPKPENEIPPVAPIPESPKPYVSRFTESKPTEEEKPAEEIIAEPVQPIFKTADAAFTPESADVYTNYNTRPKPEPKPSFFERNPDLEKFIGENLVSKIGIAILVLAIAFFVKYAIDNDWIGPIGRVSVGILCGGILIALAHRMRNTYRGFSSVLAGGGLAVFYFTITLAFDRFQLFSQTTAFSIMIVITGFAVMLSLLYNKQELAIIALIGGFAAPFLVSNGEGNYKVLFIYLVILNNGLLAIAYNRSWRMLNFLSWLFTVIIFGSWLIGLPYSEPKVTYRNGLFFGAIFYLLYFFINIAHNIREKKRFITSDFSILLANTCLFFSAGIYCLGQMEAGQYKGLFSASMGVFNLVASYFLFRRQKTDINILYLLIGITLSFISITAPLQLHGNHITLFWATEAVLLYWLFGKSRISLIQYTAVLVWILMLASLFIDWVQLYFINNGSLQIILNKGFITGFFAAGATYIFFLLRKKEKDRQAVPANYFLPGQYTFRITALLLLFATGAFEIGFQFSDHYPDSGIKTLYLLLYTLSFISILTFISEKVKSIGISEWYRGALFCLCFFIYLSSLSRTFEIQEDMLTTHSNGVHFIAHWLIAILMITVMYRLVSLLRYSNKITGTISTLAWPVCAVIVIFFSCELLFICNQFFYNAGNSLAEIQRVYVKTALPVLWGLCSFAFMWLGMRYKFRTLRIISCRSSCLRC